MSEAYQHTECELRNDIDNINCISYTFERYVKEVNHFIDRLLEDTKEINVLRSDIKEKDKEIETHIKLNKQLLEDIDRAGKEIERLNNIIKEVREYIEIIVKNTPSSTRKDYANMLLIDYKKLLEILDKGE